MTYMHALGTDAADKMAQEKGLQWVQDRIDRGDFKSGDWFTVTYSEGTNVPEVQAERSK